MELTSAPIVFLHLPKTAGQTVHNALSRMVKARRVSPVRVHTQTDCAADQYPPGYSLYSGHLDWTEIGHLPQARFLFTVLRDPGERIASFYFYLRRVAADLSPETRALPQNIGFLRARDWSPDDYFFAGDADWQCFVRSHYDNFYCSYFATRRILGWGATQGLTGAEVLALARPGLASLDAVFSTYDMARMEAEFHHRYGARLDFTGRFDNTCGEPATSLRWPRLLASFQTDRAARQMQDFVALDMELTKGLL